MKRAGALIGLMLALAFAASAQTLVFAPGVAETVTNPTGQGYVYTPIYNATIYVCTGVYGGTACSGTSGNLASVYSGSAGGTPVAQPLTSDLAGNWCAVAGAACANQLGWFTSGNYYATITPSTGGAGQAWTQQLSIGVSSGGTIINATISGGIIGPLYQVSTYTSAGDDIGQALNACYAALPAAGGVCDMRSLTGALATSTQINIGSITKPVVVLQGASKIVTSAASPAITVDGNSQWIGTGSGSDSAGAQGLGQSPGDSSWIDCTNASGTACVSWRGSYGEMRQVFIEAAAGDGLDLITTSADGSGGTKKSIQGDRFVGLQVQCDQNAAGAAVQLAAYDSTSLVAFDRFDNLRTYGCLYGVEMTTTGTQGPTDDQILGGQITRSATGGTGLYLHVARDSQVRDVNIAGWATGAQLDAGAGNLTLDDQFESNTGDIACNGGDGDTILHSGNLASNTCTNLTYNVPENSSGPNGSAAWFNGTAFSKLAVNTHGWGLSFATDTASAGATVNFEDLSGTTNQYAATTNLGGKGLCLGCAGSAPGSDLSFGTLKLGLECEAPNSNWGLPCADVSDSTGRNHGFFSQGFSLTGNTGNALEVNVAATGFPVLTPFYNGNQHIGIVGWGGGWAQQVVTVATAQSPYAVPDQYSVVEVDASGGNVVIDLPTAATFKGQTLEIIRVDGSESTHTVTVDAQAGQTVNGAATTTINAQYGVLSLVADGATAWVGPASLSASSATYLTASTPAASKFALTGAVPTNVVSLALPPGTWDVQGICALYVNAGAWSSFNACAVTTTSATLPGDDSMAQTDLNNGNSTAPPSPVGATTLDTPLVRVTLAATTTVYVVTQANTQAGTVDVYGYITARQVR